MPEEEIDLKNFRLQRELARNTKRLEEIKTEQRILETRSREIKEKLGIKDPSRLSNRERARRHRELNKSKRA